MSTLRERLAAKNLPAWGAVESVAPIRPERSAGEFVTPVKAATATRRRKAKDRHPGIACHLCAGRTRVLETRVHPAGVYRRRQCLQCGARLSSVERIEEFGKENA